MILRALLSLLLVGLIAAVVAAGYAWPQAASSAADTPDGDIQERRLVCPAVGIPGDGEQAVTAFVDPAVERSTGSISLAGGAAQPLPDPGQSALIKPSDKSSLIEITATQDAVAGTASVREYLDPSKERRGLALASCVPVQSEWRFVGVSALPGRVDELLLANPTDSPAVVSLALDGPAGPIELVGAGVVVQPGGQEIVRIDALMPGIEFGALHVATSGGVVAAALRSTAIDGLTPLGVEFLPAAAAPSTVQVVPGVPGGGGDRELVLAAGDQDSVVQVDLLTTKGSRAEALDPIPVPAGHVVDVDLSRALDGAAAAVRVIGSQPVSAAVRSTLAAEPAEDAASVLTRIPAADYAWSAAQPALVERAYLPLSGVAEAAGSLAVSSLDSKVTLRVTTRAADGSIDQQDMAVPAGAQRTVALPIKADRASLVTVDLLAGSGDWFAAVTQRGTLDDLPLITTAGASDPDTSVPIPSARPVPVPLSGD